MSKKIAELSVFFPAYNEQGSIENTVLKAKNILQTIAKKWEIIIVNDGSSDKTLEISRGLSKKDKNIRIINHRINKGYGAALQSGFYSSRYSWISFTDSDGQFDFSEINKFIAKQKETSADLIIGYYKKRKVAKSVILSSKIWEIFVFILFGLKVRDIDCAFKLISKEVVDKIEKLESQRGAFISSELLIKAKRAGFKIEEIGITHYERSAGSSTGRNLGVIIESFKDLFRLWLKLNLRI